MGLLLVSLPAILTLNCRSSTPCEGPDRDNCLASLAATEMTDAPQNALETARSIEDRALRELAIVNVLTRSGAFDGHAIRTLCHNEVRTEALRAQCDYALERPHLGVAEPNESGSKSGNLAPSLPGVSACKTHPDSDACRFERATELDGSHPEEAIQALSEIGDPELRGRAACATLRAASPTNISELRAWTPLLSLVEDSWAEEAASVLGTEHVAFIARSCTSAPKICDSNYRQELLPFAVETCSSTRDTSGQCFDHLCGLDVELTLDRYPDKPAAELVDLLRRRHRLAMAVDSRIGAVRGCMATWFGRKLVDGVNPEWSHQRCRALGSDAQTCLDSLNQATRSSTP